MWRFFITDPLNYVTGNIILDYRIYYCMGIFNVDIFTWTLGLITLYVHLDNEFSGYILFIKWYYL